MLVASNMVGSGIFLLPATLAAVGSITTLGWIFATAGALVMARIFGRLARHAPLAGGPISYATVALGPFMGFQATAIYWFSLWMGNIAIAIAAIGYLAEFFPRLAGPSAAAGGAIGLIWLLGAVNIWGPRRVCQLESAAFFCGLVPIVMVIGGGIFYFHPALFAAAWNVTGQPAYRALPPSLVLMFWAFAGIESASIATAVVRDPERNVARATYYGVIIAALIYVVSCSIILGLMPAGELARSTAPFADAIRIAFGPWAAALVGVMALAKVIGSLGGWILLTLETGAAGAEQGLFPRMFGRRNRAGIPVANLLVVEVVMSVGVVATISPTLGRQFGDLISVSVMLSLLLYIYACLAIWHYAAEAPGQFAHDRTYAFVGILFCLAILLLSGTQLLGWTAAVVFITFPFYPLCRGGKRLNSLASGQHD